MDFRILGPIEVIDDDRPLALGGTRQRALLGMLLLHAGEVVSSDRLIEELWPGERREDASGALQVAVSRLRRSLEPARKSGTASRLLFTRAPGYGLLADPDRIDAKRFEALAERGRRSLTGGAPGEARELLGEALGLWRGPPLADLAYESFCQAEIGRLEELRLAALEDWIAAGLELGEHKELVGRLRALVREQPLRERPWAQLMLALYRAGRQAEALDAYAEARTTLVEELGIEPGRELRELQQAILEQDPGLELEAAPAASAAPSPPPGRGAFVGRAPELAELLEGLDEVLSGEGRLFLLAGEPGIGKSRLAEELAAHASARGARVLVGRCWEAGGAPAYWPWLQSLRAYVREADLPTLERQLGDAGPALAQLLPELRQRLPTMPEAPELDPVGARFMLFDAVAGLLRRASEQKPTVLVLDDLHAADAPSLLLLRYLARELGAGRVLVIAAYRDVDPVPSEILATTLAELAREPVTRRLALSGLSASEVESYVDHTAAAVSSPELVTELHRETEGNPLFVGEIVRLLAAEGNGADGVAGARLGLSQTVHDVIAHRLGRLSADCRDVLVPASALGREFPLTALARMAELTEDELLELLDEAMSARVVAELPGTVGRLRFAHVLIRDSLYDGLTQARRLRLHRSAVDAFEALYGPDSGAHLAELAHHAAAAGDPVKGLDYAERAGDRALGQLAYEEAARLYSAALELADRDEHGRCRLLLALGEAHARAGETPSAKEAFVEAADAARRLGLGREVARAAAGYGGRIVWGRAGDDERLVPLLEAGLEAVPEEDVELRVRLLARLGGALRDEPSRERRDAISAQAVAVARESGNDAALAYALDGRVAVVVGPDTVAECFALATELIELAEQVGDRERIVQGRCSRMIARLQRGDLSGTELDLEAATRVATDLRQPAHLWQVSGVRAMLALATGRLTEGARLVPETFDYGERVVGRAAASVYWLQRLTLTELRGESLEEYQAPFRTLVLQHPARVMFRCALAYVHARTDQPAEASRALAELTRDDCAALPFDQEWTFGMSLLAETCALLGEAEPARVLYQRLVPWARLNVVDQAEGIRGSVSRYLGLLAATSGRWTEAEGHFDEALKANAAMGLEPWLERTREDRERMERARAEHRAGKG